MKNLKCVELALTFACLIFVGHSAAQINETQDTRGHVVLTVDSMKSTKKGLEVKFSLRNDGALPIYYSTNPQQIDGTYGSYVSVDENDHSVAKVERRVFDRDIVFYVEAGGANKTRVELKRLEPGKAVSESLTLGSPLTTTMPPLTKWTDRKMLNGGELKKLRLTVGYYDEEDAIINFLKGKPFGWFIKGFESLESGIHHGKAFYEIQKLVSAEVSLEKR
jgi:hypothetical protein